MRAPRLGGHPLHPILTDFPVALLGATVLWDVVGLATGDGQWQTVAYWTLALGVAALVPAAVTGFLDFLALPQGHPAGGTAVAHMSAVLVAGGLFVASLLARAGPGAAAAAGLEFAHAWAAGGLIALVVGGRLGGALVFRHGVGRADGASDGGGQASEDQSSGGAEHPTDGRGPDGADHPSDGRGPGGADHPSDDRRANQG